MGPEKEGQAGEIGVVEQTAVEQTPGTGKVLRRSGDFPTVRKDIVAVGHGGGQAEQGHHPVQGPCDGECRRENEGKVDGAQIVVDGPSAGTAAEDGNAQTPCFHPIDLCGGILVAPENHGRGIAPQQERGGGGMCEENLFEGEIEGGTEVVVDEV